MIQKYEMKYKDVLRKGWTVKIWDMTDTYDGNPLPLTAGESPCVINMTGDEDDIFDPIRTGSASVNILVDGVNANQLIADISSIGEREFWCNVESDNFQWGGWVTPNQAVRTFSEKGYELQMEVKDSFSAIKGLTLQGDSQQLIYGVIGLAQLLTYAMRKSEEPSFSTVAEFISGAETEFGGDIWEFLGVDVDMFNDDHGRPTNGSDVVTKIMMATASFIYKYNNTDHVINPAFLDPNTAKSLYVKSPEHNVTDFLIGDDEQITMVRSSKEISAKTDFKDQSGFLKNAFFNGWDVGELLEWSHTAGGDVTQIGNGRKYSPYQVKLSSSVFEEYARIYQQTGNVFQAGSVVILNVAATYFDYVNGDPTDDPDNFPSPRPGIGRGYNVILPLMLKLDGDDGNIYYSAARIFSNDYNDRKNAFDPGWFKSGDLASSPFDANYDQGFVGLAIGLDSTRAEQTLTIQMPKLPASGQITVYVQAALLYEYNGDSLDPEWTNRTNSHIAYTPVSLSSVLLTEKVDKTYNGVIQYLTQVGDTAQVKDTFDIEIDTTTPTNVAGSAVMAEARSGVLVGEKINWVLVDGQEYALSEFVLRCRMYFERNTRDKIEFSYRSNSIFFSDLLKLEGFHSGVFLQLTNSYDTKLAEQKCLAVELKGQFKDEISNAEPTLTKDLYEIYNIT